MTDILDTKNASKFYCKSCDFICSKQSNFNKHLLTLKHKTTDKLLTNTDTENAENAENAENSNIINNFVCECGKEYKHRQSL